MNRREIEEWLVARVAKTLQLPPSDVDLHQSFDAFGLSSADAVRISGDLADLLECDVSPTVVYEYPDIATLAQYLAEGDSSRSDAIATAPATNDVDVPIAVVGISCRFPGAADPEAFWRMLCEGGDAIREVPADRWDSDAVYHPDPSVPGKASTRWGGFLDRIDGFDAHFFGISPGEAERMDPQQRLLLELAYEAFEDADCVMPTLAGSSTGVFVGVSSNEYVFRQLADETLVTGHSGTGNALAIAANRISYFFDLHGPSMVIDTACSSSLVAVHLACQSLRAGECQLALAGGANIILSPASSIAFTKAGVLAADGRCKVFDAAADGYVRGEGAGLVVLKTLPSAIADGDDVLCVIRGSAVLQDGRTNGLMAPNGAAQERMLRAAYRNATIDPRDVDYVETHGTGTLLGDSIEARALGAVIGINRRNGNCLLGSVKSNIGHLEAAAGIAGMIKAVMALREGAIPPSLHFQTPNPHVEFDTLGLSVAGTLTRWPGKTPRRVAGVSSFGFGGTLAHVVLETAPPAQAPTGGAAADTHARLLPISAHSQDALTALLLGYRDRLMHLDDASSLAALCARASRRGRWSHRLGLVGGSASELTTGIDAYLNEGMPIHPRAKRVVFVFSGQGSQWVGMGRTLFRDEPVFHAAILECGQALSRYVDWLLVDELHADEASSRYTEIDVVQPVLFAIQVALARLWMAWGIQPDAVVGHSMGEVAAAHIAGGLSLDDAARVICARSAQLRQLSGHGTMALIGLSKAATANEMQRLELGLAIAAINSAESTVVSGTVEEVATLVDVLEQRGTFARRINVDVASHSSQVLPLATDLLEQLSNLDPSPPSIPFISTVTGDLIQDRLDSAYWVLNLTQPVRFHDAVEHLLRTEHTDFVEVSPHPVLQTAIQQTMADNGAAGAVWQSTHRDAPERESLLRGVAALFQRGVDAAGPAIRRGSRQAAPPRYPWQRQRFWMESEPVGHGAGARPARNGKRPHPLLGQQVLIAHDTTTRSWQLTIDAHQWPFLRDHRVAGEVLLPGAAIVEMALAAGAQQLGHTAAVIDLELMAPMILKESERRVVQVSIAPAKSGQHRFSMHSKPAEGDVWQLHAQATIAAATEASLGETLDPAAMRRVAPNEVSVDSLYHSLEGIGLEYGPALRGIEQLWQGSGCATARISIPTAYRHEASRYCVHPALLDSALQVVVTASGAPQAMTGGIFVPASIGHAAVTTRWDPVVWVHATMRSGTSAASGRLEADVVLFDDSGRILGRLDQVQLASFAPRRVEAPAGDTDVWHYRVEWRRAALPLGPRQAQLVGEGSAHWLITGNGGGLATAIAAGLERLGQRCTIAPLDDVADRVLPHGGPWRGVICLPIDHPAPAADAGRRPASPYQDGSVALRLVRELVDTPTAGTPRLWMVTRNSQPVRPGDPVSPVDAPLWGLGRTIALELPNMHCTLVDLATEDNAVDSAQMLLRQLCVDDDESQVALRDDGRWVPRLIRAEPSAPGPGCPPRTADLSADGCYVVTGGLGGLGLAVAAWLVERGARHLVLIGRSAPTPETAAVIARLRGDGTTEVEVLAVDVAQAQQLDVALTLVRSRRIPIRGVIHAAGILDNAAIVDLDHERLTRVLEPKARGAWNLHTATASDRLDFFILFSSAVTVLGSPGQCNYTAANAFLDALAHHRQRLGLPATSVNWGPWSNVGLVASGSILPTSTRGATAGIKGIDPASGLRELGALIASAEIQRTILPFDITALLQLYPQAAAAPFFAEVRGSASVVSRLYTRPSLRQEYVAPRTESEQRLAELWRQTLRIDRVGVKDSFFELGGDSVLAAQIVASAHRVFGVRIDLREAFQAFTVEELARRIDDHASELTIPPRPDPDAPPPLSYVQERQLFLELLDPGTAVNNLTMALRIRGPLDVGRLQSSGDRLAIRHEALRTTFDVRQGRPIARIMPHLKLNLTVTDLRDTGHDPMAMALAQATAVAQDPLPLDGSPLLRVRLFQTASTEHLLLIVVHHTIADGWSLGVFLRGLFGAYQSPPEQAATSRASLPIQYGDYAAWQRQTADQPAMAAQLAYWQQQLGGDLPVLELATDAPRPARQTFAGGTHRFQIAKDVGDAIRSTSRRHDVTPFMALMAGWQAVLHRWTGQDDIIVGTPTAGRHLPEVQDLIGVFINTLALRTDLSGDPTFAELLGRVRGVSLAAYANQDLPFERLVAELRPPRDLSRTPIFQALFILQNSPLEALAVPGLDFDLLPIDHGASEVDVTLMIIEHEGGYQCSLEYNSDLFDPATIERLSESYHRLLAHAVNQPETPVSQLELMSEAERQHLILEVNRTAAEYPRDRRVHQLFEMQAAAKPEAIAVVCDERQLSYRELDAAADALAATLRHTGVSSGDVVAVRMHRSLELVVALLAVQKAGGVYLPIAPSTPPDRCTLQLADAAARLVLCAHGDRLELTGVATRVVDMADLGTVPPVEGRIEPAIGAEGLAYLLYTSGSTGKPKGVPVTHRSMVNLLWAFRDSLDPQPGDRWLAVTSAAFDIAGLELFLPLLTGGTVVVASEGMATSGRAIGNAIRHHDVRFMQATPAMWRMLLQSGWDGAPQLVALCGGEALSQELADALVGRVDELWNCYGPTETTIWSSAGRIARHTRVTIGNPIANTQLYLLDDRLQLLPIGATGELCIGGDGVASGYHGRPDLTAERFVVDRFAVPANPTATLFRTGDRARRRPDGAIEVLGRLDGQVKVHGFRVEVGEIEAAMRQHPAIGDAAVVTRPGCNGEKTLIGYFTTRTDRTMAPQELRGHLRQVLPAYMVPAVLTPLVALPLTQSGKVDRLALAAAQPSLTEPEFVAATTPLETILTATYAQVLGVDRIGIHDNFFDLGGGSIQIIEIISRGADAGVLLTPELFFEHQTVAELAAAVGAGVHGD